MRLPRAEDEVVVFIAVDGEPMRAEGIVKRITLHAGAGINILTGQLMRETVHTDGELTIQLRSLTEVHELEEKDAEGNTTLLIVPEGGRSALPPGS